jgi:hypothetical protein
MAEADLDRSSQVMGRDVFASLMSLSMKHTWLIASGLVRSEESDLGFPAGLGCAIELNAHWCFLHGILG